MSPSNAVVACWGGRTHWMHRVRTGSKSQTGVDRGIAAVDSTASTFGIGTSSAPAGADGRCAQQGRLSDTQAEAVVRASAVADTSISRPWLCQSREWEHEQWAMDAP